jgi:FAD-dependent urate hydroxylase
MHILILGAGIAGAACALTLQRQGHRITVLERQQAPDTMGGGVVLWPNASWVLEQMGLLAAVAAKAGTPVQMRRLNRHGQLLSALDISQLDTAMGQPSHAILRRDLQSVLLDQLQQSGVEVHYGQKVVSLTDGADQQARVHLSDGQVLQADLILGAEGRMNSSARQFVLDGAASPRYQGFLNWVGMTQMPVDQPPLFDAMAIHDYWGQGLRFGIVPVSSHTFYWAGAQTALLPPESAPSNLQAHLLDLFSSWPEPVRRVIKHSQPQAIRQIAIHDHDPVDCWHRGNVLLVGDAAHAALPTSGQGACQALEDAYHLAQCLQGHDLQTALPAFTTRRQTKTRQITLQARAVAQALFNTDEHACQQRDEQARQADTRQIMADMARGWGSGLPLSS